MDKYTILYLMLLFLFVNIAGSNVYPLLPPRFLLPPNYVKHRTCWPDYMMPYYGESIRKRKQINMHQVSTLSATCQAFSLHIRFSTFIRVLQNSYYLSLFFFFTGNQSLKILLMPLRVVLSHPIDRCQLPLFLCGIILRHALHKLPEFSCGNKTSYPQL